ncbi:Saccharopine dehydrogenase NADP binding domain-containing protein [Lentzea fradiae]|uniref:Saccharopine dehydrogenase NADP binding domain-containing protein n=1 Tax=Lentzea fradiae TaxID=200378 RepID=A0A1G7L1I8_9PSEU|nr:saccharopine dehydrogenase NADP-binding domain-containing protein [Lentzea fradiae]SDF43231.1 Saccharopine dehydrogenase NADP binding domain-containing protein [Lentzea fradiae]
MSGPVAVLGAAGTVGRSAVGLLHDLGIDDVVAGDRDTTGGAVHVDAEDPVPLRRFCAGAEVVLNCAGPSYALLDRVARAALAAGAHYVDISGDRPVHHLLTASGAVRGRARAVLSAGMTPGLANLVPRVLAADGLAGADLVVHAGGVERFSPAAAGDLVLTVDGVEEAGQGAYWYGEALAAWRDGRVVSGALVTAEDVELPYFPGRVTLVPFLTADAARLARQAGLASLDWFTVFTGSRLRPALSRLRGRVPREPAALAAAAAELIEAGELDRAGQDPYHLMTFTLHSGQRSRTAVLRTTSSFRLSAATAALTVRAVLDGSVPPGLHHADEVLDAEATLRGVVELGVLSAFDVHDHDRWSKPIEEGML